MRGRKTLAVAGLLVCTMAISGVAGAEQRIQQDSNVRVLLKQSNSSQEQRNNTDDQYADQDSGSSEENRGNKPNDESPAPKPEDENGEQAENADSRDGESDKSNPEGENKDSTRGGETSSNATPEPQQNQNTRPENPEAGQSTSPPQNETPQRASRSNASRSGGEQRVDEDRTVQSPKIQSRVRQLEAQERAGKIRRAATGQSAERRPQELRIAREEIVAEPVDEAELRRYKELYEEAAEEYGFGEDWYILAAVGKVESDHGQNMGPSSAGALGPMQFMPSTWAAYGIDANGDGEANIMDPEDAIPSAARYLKAGGAPDDWYKALFTYNHAGWYVEDVLEVAEGYRQAAGDDEVGPYYLEDR